MFGFETHDMPENVVTVNGGLFEIDEPAAETPVTPAAPDFTDLELELVKGMLHESLQVIEAVEGPWSPSLKEQYAEINTMIDKIEAAEERRYQDAKKVQA